MGGAGIRDLCCYAPLRAGRDAGTSRNTPPDRGPNLEGPHVDCRTVNKTVEAEMGRIDTRRIIGHQF